MDWFQVEAVVSLAHGQHVGVVPRLQMDEAAGNTTLTMTAAGLRHHLSFSDGTLSFESSESAASGALRALPLGSRTPTLLQGDLDQVLEAATSQARSALYDSGQSGFTADAVCLMAVEVDGTSLLLASGAGQPGFFSLQPNSNGSLRALHSSGDNRATYAADVHLMAAVELAGQSFVLAASRTEAGLSAYRLGAQGQLSHSSSLGAEDGVGIHAPSALLVTEAGGEPLVLLGAAGSSSISVMGLNNAGQLSLRHHLTDTLATRFGALSVLEAVTHNGQTWVVAGGGDDGLTLLALLPGGRLSVVETLADSAALSLANVNGLQLHMDGNQLHIFASSEQEAGLTHLRLSLSEARLQQGSSGDDDLVAPNSGALFLDGAGQDQLTGGAGADIFVLTADGDRDSIHNFDLSQDRIDLSAWAGLSSVGQIDISATSDGAVLRYGGEEIRLYTGGLTPLSYVDFLRYDLLGLHRPPLVEEPAMTLRGSGQLVGGAGHDHLTGQNGNDTLYGQDGNDHLAGSGGHDRLFGGLGQDTLEGSGGRDQLEGEDGSDSLSGGTGDDTLYGGAGNDRLFGNTALDTLYGGAGDDYISAGDGVDWADGGLGNDTIHGRSGWDSLYGGEGHDHLYGSSGDDYLAGGRGHDWISAGSAWDAVYGNSGNDTLYGNFGSDVLSGGDGSDQLYGGTGDDSLWGGGGDDLLQGNQGVDVLEGDAGNDTLRGGTLADTFVFGRNDDQDEIEDFRLGEDILRLEEALRDGAESATELLADHARLTNEGLVINFGHGDVLTFSNLFDVGALSALADDIVFG